MTVLPSNIPPFLHPFAVVESNQIGQGTRIWGWTHIQADVIIGKNCNIGEHCFIENGVKIGNNVVVKNGISLWNGVTVLDDAFLGPHAVFTNERYPRSGFPKQYEKIVIEQGASLGAGVVVVPGVTIGRYATVGAGSVVTKKVVPHALVFGNPAIIFGWMCICGLKLSKEQESETVCSCGRKYSISAERCQTIE